MAKVARWITPWAALGEAGSDYMDLPEAGGAVRWDGAGVLLLCLPDGKAVSVDGARASLRRVFQLDAVRSIFILALPLRPSARVALTVGSTTWQLTMPAMHDRPSETEEPATPAQYQAHALLARVLAVWARLRDVELCLADPATIWPRLAVQWLDAESHPAPRMDPIVSHARRLGRTLALLDRAPRRVLRRQHRPVPLDRVQEMDRRSMLWLVRQPGTSLVEQAGDRQRILAVAREQSFDTLENRVLHSYARLAHGVAREYDTRQRRGGAATAALRLEQVRRYSKTCRRLAADLRERGVREAPADATPNFVLQNNASYRSIWDAWRELLGRARVVDELWRWQARSWEEFCALAAVVALQSCPGARVIATSPLLFRDEQDQGRWLRHVNPLAVFYLPEEDVIVEVAFDPGYQGPLRYLGAPIWLRFGRLDDTHGFLRRCAIWPIWDAHGGLVDGEVERVERLLGAPLLTERPGGGIVVRPVADGHSAAVEHGPTGRAVGLAMSPEGEARVAGITLLREALLHALRGWPN
jgi:hypothetical protein